jgi:hypothetical protein
MNEKEATAYLVEGARAMRSVLDNAGITEEGERLEHLRMVVEKGLTDVEDAIKKAVHDHPEEGPKAWALTKTICGALIATGSGALALLEELPVSREDLGAVSIVPFEYAGRDEGWN